MRISSFASPFAVCIAAPVIFLAGCGSGAPADTPAAVLSEADIGAALESIAANDLLTDIQVLASDSFLGRGPGTLGGRRTVDYLIERFRDIGVAPGNPDGTYVQDVPLVGVASHESGSLAVGGQTFDLETPENWIGVTYRVAEPVVTVENSELIFVGYGVRAPEYDWDDFKGLDVAGKTLVMLINDPPVADAENPATLDEEVFNGRAMTYYGRWTYKYEQAAELGAAAVLIVHETEPAGYPWAVVTGSWGVEQFDIQRPGGGPDRLAVEAWITRDLAERLFAAAGHDFEALKEAASHRDFQPVPLGGTADFRIATDVRNIESQNVVAKIPGADPERRAEYVVYTAHWDHLGVDGSLEGDSIYNGALDNATGTAGLLELAEAFAAAPSPPERTMVFLAVTAEEKGLLGAKYYAANPLYPLSATLANINMDGLNQWGRTEDIVVIGYGMSTLDNLLADAAAAQGRQVVPDPEPEKGYYYRSDHFEFAKRGIPAIFTDMGTRYVGRPEGYGIEKRQEYTAEDYHKPSDEIKPGWDLSGAVQDLRLLFRVGYRVAQSDAWPAWNPGTEFKAVREAMLADQVL